jgi:hypothetical protein
MKSKGNAEVQEKVMLLAETGDEGSMEPGGQQCWKALLVGDTEG